MTDSAASKRYATLVVARKRVEGRQVGDTFVPEAELAQYYEEHIEPEQKADFERLQRIYESARDEYKKSLQLRRGDREQRRLGMEYFVLTPTGTRVGGNSEESAVSHAMQEWGRAHAKPDSQASRDGWMPKQPAHSRRFWVAELVHGDGRCESHDLTEAHISWWGAPVAATNALLDRLSSAGWMLVHISEDRGLYRGVDTTDESYPTRIRYLLSRERPVGRPSPFR